jgi:hypothetical protein
MPTEMAGGIGLEQQVATLTAQPRGVGVTHLSPVRIAVDVARGDAEQDAPQPATASSAPLRTDKEDKERRAYDAVPFNKADTGRPRK